MSNQPQQERVPGVAEGSALIPPQRSWSYGIAPHYIGMFLWVVFCDRLGRTTLPIGGLGFSMLGALIAGILCNELLFKGPALWGHQADKTTMELAPRVFGALGARAVGVVIGLAEIVWFAVGVAYGTEWTLDGLQALGFFDASYFKPFEVGRWTLPNKLYLFTSLFWCFAVALTATWLIRVIGAIMNAYPIFPALALGVVMLMLIPGLPRFGPTGIDPTTGQAMPTGQGSLLAILRMIQLIFGFFAMAGVLSADWGKGSLTTRDVHVGGWVGVVFAPLVVAAITLMTVAGYQGKVDPVPLAEMDQPEPGVLRRSTGGSSIVDARPVQPPQLVLRDAIRLGVGGGVSGVMLLVLGLGALAPSVYASFKYAHRFKESIGGISRVAWMLVATACSWPLIAIGATRPLEQIFGLMGAVFGPMAGAYTAIAARDQRTWTGDRPGINLAGALGWLIGVAVGLLPILPSGSLGRLEPAALWAFVAGYLATRLLAFLGLDPRPIPLATPPETSSPEQSEA